MFPIVTKYVFTIIQLFVCLKIGSSEDITKNVVLTNHSAWKILDKFDCGESAADRIIGGFNASLGQFPWIVRLGYSVPAEDNSQESEIDFMCGGTLISDRHVVTAAHCVKSEDYGDDLCLVRLGELNANIDPDCQKDVCAPPVQDRKIAKVVPHSSFNNPAFHNDIAVIVLDTPVNFNDYVSPICLPRDAEQKKLAESELVTVAGWGKINMTTDERAIVLQYIQVPVLSPSACATLGKSFQVGDDQICAGAQHNKDACGGDSGGPLMKVCDTKEGPKTFLVGAVSFGPTICGIKKPGVYASIPHFLKWILDEVEKTQEYDTK